jgi:CRP/FNR family transcriptional regulator, cyclic AMP receptor protein
MEQHLQANLKIVKAIPFFASYSEEIQQKIADKMIETPFQKDEVIIHEGTAGRRLYIIKKGSVRVSKEGKEIAVLKEGAFFGEISLITSEYRTATVQALEDVDLIILTKEDFQALTEQGLFKDVATREELFRRIRENYERGF